MTKETFIAACAFDIVNAIRETIERMGLVDTGYLKNHIIFTIEGSEIVLHFPNYAEVLEFGCQAFEIRPKNKKALFWKGASNPVKVVRHPGIRAYAFIRSTLHNQLNKIIQKNAELHLFNK